MSFIQRLAAIALTSLPFAAFAPASLAQTTETQSVRLQFQGMVGDEAFSCESTYAGLGTMGSTVAVTDFRLYVSDVQLINEAGDRVPVLLQQDGVWQYENVALLDFEDRSGTCTNGTSETRTEVVGTVPTGTYTGVEFTLGVPFELNHNDATLAPSPLNLTAMWWNWQGGYKFVRIDLENEMMMGDVPQTQQHSPHGGHGGHGGEHGGDHGGMAQGFLIHLGSTACQLEGDAMRPTTDCGNPNTSVITFEDFDPTSDVIVADLAALVADSNLMMNEPDTALGCMSGPDDDDCLGILHNFGLSHSDQPSPGQTFFRIK
ncbi:MAG: MbnP family copper-binding protein [Cyanobacteria bacterium J06638_20]